MDSAKRRISLLLLFLTTSSLSLLAEEWRHFSFVWDKAPVDLSFLLDPPAGKHGFLDVKGNRFVFEDGTAIRFWGTSLAGSACFPPQEIAPAIAERLAKFGFNLVRFKDLDAPWAEPNLLYNTSDPDLFFNPAAIDRLDFFLSQLENRGIYAYLDGLDSRQLQEEDSLPAWQSIPPGMKPYIHFVPALQWMFQDYLSHLWGHRNRYTQLEYRDSPSIALAQIFLDGGADIQSPMAHPHSQILFEEWENWNKTVHPGHPIPLDQNTPMEDIRRFQAAVSAKTSTDILNHLHSISVKIPLAAAGIVREAWELAAMPPFDFLARESVWNEPYGGFRGYLDRSMSAPEAAKDTLFSRLAFSRDLQKPFLVSEWGDPWPNRWRAETPLWLAAIACLQAWNGCISSSYCTNHDPNMNYLFAPWELFNDPCLIGLFPAAALLFLREDVEPARKQVQMALPEATIFNNDPITPENAQTTRLVETMQVGTRWFAKPAGKNILAPTQPEYLDEFIPSSSKKQNLRRDSQRGLVIIDSQRTQALIGKLSAASENDLKDVEIESGEEFGVVCVSSLDGKPISRSQDLWITLVSEAQNSGFSSLRDREGFTIQDPGYAPILVKDASLRLFIRISGGDWKLSAIDGGGEIAASLPFQIQNDRLSFRAGTHGVLYYRLNRSRL
ncbi:MAG: hypothetical protein AB1656_02870 [Candidatus Omnitrophota bacterium]